MGLELGVRSWGMGMGVRMGISYETDLFSPSIHTRTHTPTHNS
jgi:hypothetical protein